MILESLVGALGAVVATFVGTGTRQGREFDKRLTIIERDATTAKNLATEGSNRLIVVETEVTEFKSWLTRVESKLDRAVERHHHA